MSVYRVEWTENHGRGCEGRFDISTGPNALESALDHVRWLRKVLNKSSIVVDHITINGESPESFRVGRKS